MLEYILRPTFLFSVVLALAVANLWRRRRETRLRLFWVTAPLVALTLISIPAVAYLAVGSLEWQYEPADPVPDARTAVVVLAGYVRDDDGRSAPELGTDTFYRCMHAFNIYEKAPECRILVSGGQSDRASPRSPRMANVMRDFLLDQGVKPGDLLVENRSHNTHENALESAKILREKDLRRIILVTDAKHMVRALRCFRKTGLDVIPAPCNYASKNFQNRWEDFVPSPTGAAKFQEAFHEWLGLVYYWARGWI
jgi:uncharacterized SAM-binding protein YcdF (DUF218 family)